MRIFYAVKHYQERYVSLGLGAGQNVIRIAIAFGGRQSDDSLVITVWNQSIERRAWLDVHWYATLSCQPDDLSKLPVNC
jgi:hypothetical protein